MNRERVKHLIEVLEKVEENKSSDFEMSTWFQPRSFERFFSVEEVDCGFTACAGGWAALDPKFMEEGLSINLKEDKYAKLIFGGKEGFEALSAFFDLSYELIFHLFDPVYYSSTFFRIFSPKKGKTPFPSSLYLDNAGEKIYPKHVISRLEFLLEGS